MRAFSMLALISQLYPVLCVKGQGVRWGALGTLSNAQGFAGHRCPCLVPPQRLCRKFYKINGREAVCEHLLSGYLGPVDKLDSQII
jgi:hypothetical protein